MPHNQMGISGSPHAQGWFSRGCGKGAALLSDTEWMPPARAGIKDKLLKGQVGNQPLMAEQTQAHKSSLTEKAAAEDQINWN